MAKPATEPTWATDANFSSGPASGQPTKVTPAGAPNVAQGFVPGEGAAGEFVNWILNLVCSWIGWVADGSSAGAADAHLVETDSNGETKVRGIRTLDGAGSYIEVSGTTGVQYRQGSVPDANTNIEGVAADSHWCTTPTAQRDHYLLEASAANTLVDGQRCIVQRPLTGNFAIIIHREGVGGAMVTLPALTACSCMFEVRSGRWRPILPSLGCTMGSDA